LYSAKHECAKARASIDTVLKSYNSGLVLIFPLYLLAKCQFEEGQLDDAIKSLLQIQTWYDNNYGLRSVFYPKSFLLLGQIYERKGDKKLAIENYEKLLHFWKDADQDLFEVIDTKARLAKLRGV
jgi:predicted negative regulator of RcsB-dependent stress response